MPMVRVSNGGTSDFSNITYLSSMGGKNVIVTAPYTRFLLSVVGYNSSVNAETPTCVAQSGSSTITSLYNNGGTGTHIHTGVWLVETTVGNTLTIYSTGNGSNNYASIYAIEV